MKLGFSLLLWLVLVGTGCVTPHPLGINQLAGEWRFAYAAGAVPLGGASPPSFDIVTFNRNGMVSLQNTLLNHQFVVPYQLAGNRLSWAFTPPDAKEPIQHVLLCGWTEHGDAMVLRPAPEANPGLSAEWVFFRADRFLPIETVTGRWQFRGDRPAVINLDANGLYQIEDTGVWGYYRLWKSIYGTTLTTVMWVQEHGAYVVVQTCERKEEKLILATVGGDGPIAETRVTLHRLLSFGTPGKYGF
jgi:hypothetical protein